MDLDSQAKDAAENYLDEIYDWDKFELFVKELYRSDEDLVVEHNIIEIGKSGRKRQIDVKITQRTRLHTYVTLVECKRWKKKIDGDIIDVLVNKVEDLNASKGVIITTEGYEKGAELYAKSKNVDIFIIRELESLEWGFPGKIIEIVLQFFSGKCEEISLPDSKLLPFKEPFSGKMDLKINGSHDAPQEDALFLYSIKNSIKGPYIWDLVSNQCIKIIKSIGDHIQLIGDYKNKSSLLITSKIEIDIADSEFRILRLPQGLLEIEKIVFQLDTLINQDLIHHDRAKNYNMALIIENYITKQRNIISRHKDSSQLELSDQLKIITPEEQIRFESTKEETTIFKVYFTFPRNFKLNGNEKKAKTNDIKITIK